MLVAAAATDPQWVGPGAVAPPIALAVALWLLMVVLASRSILQHEERLGFGGTLAWIIVVIVAGPIGVAAWHLLGRDGEPPPGRRAGPTPYS